MEVVPEYKEKVSDRNLIWIIFSYSEFLYIIQVVISYFYVRNIITDMYLCNISYTCGQ